MAEIQQQPLYKRDPTKKFTHVEELLITTVGTSAQAGQVLIEVPILITKAYVSAFYKNGLGVMQAVTRDIDTRDPLLIEIRKEGGDTFSSNPVEMFAFNAEYENNPGFSGWFIGGATKLSIRLTHVTKSGVAPVFAAPIVGYLHLFGYKQV